MVKAGVMKTTKKMKAKQISQISKKGQDTRDTAAHLLQKLRQKDVAKRQRLTPSGQHPVVSTGCLSTSLKGTACPRPRFMDGVPYCLECLESGDPSLTVTDHPKFGKILIAARDLPKGYLAAWWGDLLPLSRLPEKHLEWALQTRYGYIDAVPHNGSQLKYCACPGPNEATTLDYTKEEDILLTKAEKAGIIFKTLRAVPRRHHVCMMYNKDEKSTDEFFAERGIVRGDMGTKQYPALRKAGR